MCLMSAAGVAAHVSAAKRTTDVTCTQGHCLWPSVALEATVCGACGVAITVNAQIYSCEVCNYEECTSCVAKQGKVADELSGVTDKGTCLETQATISVDQKPALERYDRVSFPEPVHPPSCSCCASQAQSFCFCSMVGSSGTRVLTQAASDPLPLLAELAPTPRKFVPAFVMKDSSKKRALARATSDPLPVQVSSAGSTGRKRVLTRAATDPPPASDSIENNRVLTRIASSPPSPRSIPTNAGIGRKRVLTRAGSTLGNSYTEPILDISKTGRKRVLTRSVSKENDSSLANDNTNKRVLTRSSGIQSASALACLSSSPQVSSSSTDIEPDRKRIRVLTRTITPEPLVRSCTKAPESPCKEPRSRVASALTAVASVPEPLKLQDGPKPGDRRIINNPPGSPHVRGLEVELVEWEPQAARWRCRTVRSW